MTNVLILGGAGYIGSVLAQQLLDAGYRVRIFDCFLHGKEHLQPLCKRDGFKMIEGDIRNALALEVLDVANLFVDSLFQEANSDKDPPEPQEPSDAE